MKRFFLFVPILFTFSCQQKNENSRSEEMNRLAEKYVRLGLFYALNTHEAALKSISFIKKYRSYLINYNYGQDLVKNHIVSKGGTDTAMDKRWELFGWLLSNEVSPMDLLSVKP